MSNAGETDGYVESACGRIYAWRGEQSDRWTFYLKARDGRTPPRELGTLRLGAAQAWRVCNWGLSSGDKRQAARFVGQLAAHFTRQDEARKHEGS